MTTKLLCSLFADASLTTIASQHNVFNQLLVLGQFEYGEITGLQATLGNPGIVRPMLVTDLRIVEAVIVDQVRVHLHDQNPIPLGAGPDSAAAFRNRCLKCVPALQCRRFRHRTFSSAFPT
jgi:hypothetical protein